MEHTLNILEIRSMAIHNGPGNRTMVHLMGCPLKCRWCSTPESQSQRSLVGYKADRCISCGSCLGVCPEEALSWSKEGRIRIDHSRCTSCMKCTQACPAEAMERIGIPYTPQEIFDEVLSDRFYFGEKGGVTFSGGEVLMSVGAALLELFEMLKEEQVSIGIDTSGYASREALEKILPYADFFLWDIKSLDDDTHIRYTGVSNDRILKNLDYVLERGKTVYIRYPLIPGINDSGKDMQLLAEFLRGHEGIEELHLLPFHHLGTSRYQKIGRADMMEQVPVYKQEELQAYLEFFRQENITVKVVG